MLFAKNRLKKKKDFEKIFQNKQSKCFALSFLAIRFLANNLPETRLGFVVSKKIAKKAVQRNKIKRWLREASRLILRDIEPGFDIIVFTRQRITKSDFASIKQKLEQLFEKAGLTKGA